MKTPIDTPLIGIWQQADLILVDLGRLNLSPVVQVPIRNAVPNLVYAASGHEVGSVMVVGKWIMQNREILTFDEASVLSEARDAADEIACHVIADPKPRRLGLLDAITRGNL